MLPIKYPSLSTILKTADFWTFAWALSHSYHANYLDTTPTHSRAYRIIQKHWLLENSLLLLANNTYILGNIKTF
jgi:hypothetical protein